MHPNPVFRQVARARNLEFARDRAFGILSVNGAEGPLVAHVPFLLSDDAHSADLHLVRSNPIARALAQPVSALIAVSGPDAYVSPDWYGIDGQVPTWNYVAVHLRGTLSLLPDAALHDLLERQSAAFEDRLLPKPPWLLDKLAPEALARMLRQIVPARLQITGVEGTWKLNQNKADDVRERAARSVAGSSIGTDVALLAALMLAPPSA